MLQKLSGKSPVRFILNWAFLVSANCQKMGAVIEYIWNYIDIYYKIEYTVDIKI